MTADTRGFELVDHTADVGIRGWGGTLSELFAAMAEGLFHVIGDPESVQPVQRRRVQLRAESPEDLLHDWLDELNLLHQTHGELYGAFEVTTDGRELDAIVRGEPLDPARHDLRTEVKAVTWHDLRIERTDRGFEAYVLLDI